ncbi:MAG TPA: hypothetical protein VGJ05_09790 [Fimbriiglobus sp.]|jgi:hypothetical protein
MPLARPVFGWLMAGTVCALTTVGLNWKTVTHLDRERSAPAASLARETLLLWFNDTDVFLYHLERSTEAVRQGRVYFPVTDFDCPASFLLPGGLLQAATGWSGLRVMNAFALAAFFLCGLAAYGLFRELGADRLLALVAAVAYQTGNCEFYYPYMGHMNSTQLQWIPAAIWALAATLRTGRWTPAGVLGLVMGVQALSSPSYTLYLAYFILTAFAIGYFLAARRAGVGQPPLRLLFRAVLAVAVALGVAAFYLVPRLDALPHTFPLDPDNGYHVTSLHGLVDPCHPMLFFGWGILVLGIFAVGASRSDGTPATVGTRTALYAAILMILPGVVGSPYWLAYQTLPLMDRTRAPIRLAPFVLLLLLSVTALTLTRLTVGRSWWVRWAAGGTLALAVAANWAMSPWIFGANEL